MDRHAVKTIMDIAKPTLRKNMNLNGEFYAALQATYPLQVISEEEHDEIRVLGTRYVRIDELIDIIKRKTVTVYLEFMRILQEKDGELYEGVKAIQDEYLTNLQRGQVPHTPTQVQHTQTQVQHTPTQIPHTPTQVQDTPTQDQHTPTQVPHTPTAVNSRGAWGQIGQFSTKPVLKTPHGIAIHPNGDVSVVGVTWFDFFFENITNVVFAGDGSFKNSFKFSTPRPPQGDIAITQDNRYVVTGPNAIVFYDRQGRRLGESNTGRSWPVTIAVDSFGTIVVGVRNNTIVIYHSNGAQKKKFTVPFGPRCLDVTSRRNIAMILNDNTMQVHTGYPGDDGYGVRVAPHPQDVAIWKPQALCCSNQDEIFVLNGGDVYQYAQEGDKCLGRIISGLDNPRAIAITEEGQRLYVVVYKLSMVKMFERQ